tara:strand:- start:592 stop:1062 length:471 start_codon:yes stop_codon:yes gene_type:complete
MADFDYQKMYNYVMADPEVTKLREQRKNTHKKIGVLKDQARSHIRKMHALHLAKSAVLDKYQYEPAGEEADETLERITGQCSECWESDWQTAEEVVFEGQLSCAVAISNLGKQIYKLNEDINIMSGCIDNLEEELKKQYRNQFNKDQQESTKEVEK